MFLHRVCNSFFAYFSSITQGKEEHKTEDMQHQDQLNFENRIACGICLEPRLRMVTGNCQHRFCIQCIYDGSDSRKKGLERCPSCQLDSAFPVKKPVIPEDTIEIQKALGVGACDRCGEEMWLREISDHQSTCRNNSSPAGNTKAASRSRRSPRCRCGDRHDNQKSLQKHKGVGEVKRLLNDLADGMTTRSHTSPRCLQELDGSGRAKRRLRSPGKARLRAAEKKSSPAVHPYRK